MDAVQIIARSFDAFTGLQGMDEDDYRPSEVAVQLAQAVLFDLAKNGIRLIEPDDVLEREDDKDAHTVKVLLKADE